MNLGFLGTKWFDVITILVPSQEYILLFVFHKSSYSKCPDGKIYVAIWGIYKVLSMNLPKGKINKQTLTEYSHALHKRWQTEML